MDASPDNRLQRTSPDRGASLLAWYATQRRDLPWRHTCDPWAILVSEVMLQQTQVDRVIPRWHAFLQRFPTARAAAEAPLAEVLEVWSGLGYNARAKRLHESAIAITERGWPDDAAGLRALPGIGPYTAAAVAAIAIGEPIAAVDTNVRRVLSRWRGRVLSGAGLAAVAGEELTGAAGDWNQAIMDLGALVCRPRNPRCDVCPVAAWCADPTVYSAPPRQSTFEGSTRQVRGAVIGVLVGRGWGTVDTIADASGHDRTRIMAAVDALVAEGLVEREGSSIRLTRTRPDTTRS